MKKISANNRYGFGLVEIIVTLMLLAVLIFSAFNIYPLLLNICMKQERRFITLNLAFSQLEDLREKAKTDFNGAYLTQGNNKSSSLTNLPASLNNVTVTYNVVDKKDWTEDGNNANVDYKSVTVTATDPTSNYTATLTGYVTQ